MTWRGRRMAKLTYLLLTLITAGCGGCAQMLFNTAAVISAPGEKAKYEALNHRFTLAGGVVDESGQPLNDVSVQVWYAPPSFSYFTYHPPKMERLVVNGDFRVVAHGREVLLWFCKSGYMDRKLVFYPPGADINKGGKDASSAAVPQSWLCGDATDAEVTLRQENEHLRVVMRRPKPGQLRTIRAGVLPCSPGRFDAGLLLTPGLVPAGMWKQPGDGRLRLTTDLGWVALQGVPLALAPDGATAIEGLREAPPLAYTDSAALELNGTQRQTASGGSRLFFARVGLCYARGSITLGASAESPATVELQIQENGSRMFPGRE